jgi:hypothetical protein
VGVTESEKYIQGRDEMGDRLAEIARQLADALMKFARSRDDNDKKHVAQLQTELCAARRAEEQKDEIDG